MEKYTLGKRVLIVRNPGKCGIEQAIFILNEKAGKDDFIIDEAKKIIDEYAKNHRLKSRTPEIFYTVIFVLSVAAIIFAVRFL